MSLADKINNDMKDAMRQKQEARLRAIRAIKSALLLAQTEKGSGKDLSEEAEMKLLQKLVKQRKESLEIYEQQNREDLAQKEREEIEVIESYLPKQMSEDELKPELKKIVDETGASSPRDMGKVMGIANQRFAGRADSKTIAAIVKDILQNQ